MRKLILLHCLLLGFYGTAMSQTLSECVRIEGQLLTEEEKERKICKELLNDAGATVASIHQTIGNVNNCLLRATVRSYEKSCSPAMKASRRVQIMLLKELKEVSLTTDEGFNQSRRILEMINKEIEEGARAAVNEFKSREAEIAAHRRYETAISILGGVLQRNTQSSDRRYLLNGRFITCRDRGNLTICD